MRGVAGERAGDESPHPLAGVGDLHAPPAQYIGGADDDRQPDPPEQRLTVAQRPDSATLRTLDVQCGEQSREFLTVLGDIQRSHRGPKDSDAGVVERPGQVERGLSAELHQHAVRLLTVNHVQDVFNRQRLEVQTV